MKKDYLGRMTIILILMVVFVLSIISRLFSLQVVNGEDYAYTALRRFVKTIPQKAQRGEILDRYGRVMVSSQTIYNLEISKYKKDMSHLNETICKLIQLSEREEQLYQSRLPISGYPYIFLESESEESVKKYLKSLKLPENTPAELVVSELSERYKITSDIPLDYMIKVIGVRAEMELREFSENNPFTFAKNVNMNVVTVIKENNQSYPGVNVMTSFSRMYPDPVAPHILGRVGPIYAEEYQELKSKGYVISDIIGKDGLEQVYDLTLKGKDGLLKIEQDTNGKIVGESVIQEAVSGDDILLTIDMNLQKKTEIALKDVITQVSALTNDPGGGAACVIDIHNGDVLAMASYPDFNIATFEEDYSVNYENPQKPFWNRAISGGYAPGSTFKILTALAALEEGIVTTNDRILDKGKYTFYPSYQPECHIYPENHGYVNVSKAIEVSCNYYFYEVGRLMGIDVLSGYGKRFGLGEYTGIELSGESKGIFINTEYRKQKGSVWYPGDTLQVAIGQSENLFTPLQLANYLATFVNGGTRFEPHLLLKTRNQADGTVTETAPKVVEQISIKPENYKAVMEGMRSVTEDGTASSTFKDFFIDIGGKTGTAEVPGTNNGLFIAFAPYDNPKIAISVVVEHGEHGNTIAPIAKEIISAYFNSSDLENEDEPTKFEVS